MPVKVIMTWDIAAERDQEYFEFVIGEFVPGVQRLGSVSYTHLTLPTSDLV